MFYAPFFVANSRKKCSRIQSHTTAYDKYDDAVAAYGYSRLRSEQWSKLMSEMAWSKSYAETQLGKTPAKYTNILSVNQGMGDSIHRALTSSRFNMRNRSALQYMLIYPMASKAFLTNVLAIDTNAKRLQEYVDEYAKRGYDGEVLWWRSYGEGPIRMELKTEFLIEKIWSDNGKDTSSIRRGDGSNSSISDKDRQAAQGVPGARDEGTIELQRP